MPALISTTTMIRRLQGCLGTGDLSQWEERFVRKLAAQAEVGQVTQLSERQIEKLEELHEKHFGDHE